MAHVNDIDTLAELTRFHARERPNRVAFEYNDRATTYAQFDQLTNRVANGLRAEGLQDQSRVGFLDKNSDHFYQIVFGAAKAGAVSVGINWRLAPPEVAYILNDSKAEVVFVGPDFYGLVEKIRGELKYVKRVIAMHPGHDQWSDFAQWRDDQSAADPGVAVTPDDVAIQMYTSGTTGHPKGVQLQHKCFFELQRLPPNDDMQWNEWTDRDVSLVAMPSFHIGGVGYGVWGLRSGAKNIVVSEFDPGATLEMIETRGISKVFLVPSAIRMVVQHPKAQTTDFSNIKYMMYGASPIPLDLLRQAVDVFKCGFVQLYGMTETTGAATYLPPQDHDVSGNERMRSAGKPYPGVELKVIDENGKPVPPRTVGEICIKSPANMIGYWNLPDATKKTLIDGYVHTGDAGYLDEAGYVYVHDRVKDMIVSGGENIYPAEVENALFGHPAVADVAVIGVPDDRWGEAVKAVVVVKASQKVTADDLIGFARSRIAGYKLPKTIDFIPELPRNPSGKVLKRELRKPYWEGRDRQVN
ncbi:MAG TPA: fatty acid--CoA ligase [Pseudomonadales bacterium]|nr:fatty acid--CoA ligase [Pseudomonadales bacterium]